MSKSTSTLIVQCPKLKKRVSRLKYIIDLAAALLSLQNFNSLMAILSGIQNDAVYRLKHTFDQLPKKSAAVSLRLCFLAIR